MKWEVKEGSPSRGRDLYARFVLSFALPPFIIFAYFGHAWLLFESFRHPFIALAVLGVFTCVAAAQTLLDRIKRWNQEGQEERAQKAEAPHAFAVYLEQREEMQQAEAKARELKQRFASADIAGSVNVIFGPDGHPKLDIKLARLRDKAAATNLATDCVRS